LKSQINEFLDENHDTTKSGILLLSFGDAQKIFKNYFNSNKVFK